MFLNYAVSERGKRMKVGHYEKAFKKNNTRENQFKQIKGFIFLLLMLNAWTTTYILVCMIFEKFAWKQNDIMLWNKSLITDI